MFQVSALVSVCRRYRHIKMIGCSSWTRLTSRLNTTTKSLSIALLAISLLYICYILSVYAKDDDVVVEKETEIVMGHKNEILTHTVFEIDEDEGEDEWPEDLKVEAKRVSSYMDTNCRVKQILSNIDRNVNYINCSRLIYNRVPKCGSRTVLSTFKRLAKMLNYKVIGVEKPSSTHNYYGKEDRLESFVENFTEIESPFLYSQHLHFINFTKFKLPPPLFINVIRDPVERQISHYYYNMYGSSNKPRNEPNPRYSRTIDECVEAKKGPCYSVNEIIPFFCGHERQCRIRSNYSLQKAKRVASESVLVIGFTEDLLSFMEVLEFLLPNYFANATTVFNNVSDSLQDKTKTVKKPDVKPETVEKLRVHLKLEYDFYYFARQRFYNLLKRIRAVKSDSKKTQYYKNKRNFFKWWKKTGSQ